MTRDQAIERYANAAVELTSTSARLIDGLAALGVLKLDTPKSAEELVTLKAVHVLNNDGWDLRIFNVLDRAGLKIVEKDSAQ